MLVVAVHQTPSLTRERYEEVVRRLTNGKSRFESPSDLPFEGLIVHASGQGKNGFCVVDVFESEEAVERFNEAMGSIPREVGIEQPPDLVVAEHLVADLGQRCELLRARLAASRRHHRALVPRQQRRGPAEVADLAQTRP